MPVVLREVDRKGCGERQGCHRLDELLGPACDRENRPMVMGIRMPVEDASPSLRDACLKGLDGPLLAALGYVRDDYE